MNKDNYNDEYENLFDSFDENELDFSSSDSDILDINSLSETALNEDEPKGGEKDKMPVKKKKNKKNRKKTLKIILIVFLCLVILGCLAVGGVILYIFTGIDPEIDADLNKLGLDYSTTIYAKDTNDKWTEYQRIHGTENRIWVEYDEDLAEAKDPEYTGIPYNLANAFVAVEDKRYYTHKGVDWRRTASATLGFLKSGSTSGHGGSSITQQLVRNITNDRDVKITRKVREIVRALELEKKYTKETILECYMNTIAMGNGIYGVEVASEYYFGKPVSQLTLAECASIAGITNLPEYYRPDINPNNNRERTDIILGLMLEQEMISKEEYDEAIAQELVIVKSQSAVTQSGINNYFVDALIDDVVDAFMEEYGYTEEEASQKIYNGGYKIYATVNPRIQSIMESVYTNPQYILTSSNGAQLQGSMTILDYSGNVVGMVGGMGTKTENRGLNRATMSPRQPGSSIKPLSAYAPAIDKNLITYSTIFVDRYKSYGNWSPTNWYSPYRGNITVQKALEISSNTIPVFTIEMLSLRASYNFLVNDLGMKHLNENDIDYAPLGMGGMNEGITTLESAAAFAIFGNGGKYYEPCTFVEIYDQYDNLIISHTPEAHVAIGEDTASIMNKLLQKVVYGPEGTATPAANFISGMKIFAKTGTSNDTYNVWFVGGSPYYVASSWCGYDNDANISNSKQARTMWGAVMRQVHSIYKSKSFTFSKNIQCKVYCAETGLLANEDCPVNDYGWYKTRNQKYCTTHKGEPVAATGESAAAAYVAANKNKPVKPPVDESSSGSSSSETSSGSTDSSVENTPDASTPTD